MQTPSFLPLEYSKPSIAEIQKIAKEFRNKMDKRRSVRFFSTEPIPISVIEDLIMTASSAPSGAHKQPWTFCIVKDENIKHQIKVAAEKEEYENYHGRMSDEWIQDLKKFDTNWHKDFLTEAPYLIVIFKKAFDLQENGTQSKNYYVNESVGIAAGFLITAIHTAGLVTLTHTPSPMNFLQKILNRPDNERPFLLLPIGFPANDVTVPNIQRKALCEVIQIY